MIFDCLQLGHFERHKLVAAQVSRTGCEKTGQEAGHGENYRLGSAGRGCPLGQHAQGPQAWS